MCSYAYYQLQLSDLWAKFETESNKLRTKFWCQPTIRAENFVEFRFHHWIWIAAIERAVMQSWPSLCPSISFSKRLRWQCDVDRWWWQKKYHERWRKHRLINCLYCWHCLHCVHCLQNKARWQWDGQNNWIRWYQNKYTIRVVGVVRMGHSAKKQKRRKQCGVHKNFYG